VIIQADFTDGDDLRRSLLSRLVPMEMILAMPAFWARATTSGKSSA
jgi:hypothetical protein